MSLFSKLALFSCHLFFVCVLCIHHLYFIFLVFLNFEVFAFISFCILIGTHLFFIILMVTFKILKNILKHIYQSNKVKTKHGCIIERALTRRIIRCQFKPRPCCWKPCKTSMSVSSADLEKLFYGPVATQEQGLKYYHHCCRFEMPAMY